MLRQEWWIISDREAIHRPIFTRCHMYMYKTQHPKSIMTFLSVSRIQIQRPFLHIEIDFGGPFLVRKVAYGIPKLLIST